MTLSPWLSPPEPLRIAYSSWCLAIKDIRRTEKKTWHGEQLLRGTPELLLQEREREKKNRIYMYAHAHTHPHRVLFTIILYGEIRIQRMVVSVFQRQRFKAVHIPFWYTSDKASRTTEPPTDSWCLNGPKPCLLGYLLGWLTGWLPLDGL